MQFPSDAAAIVKQGDQSLFGCLEGGSEAASGLFLQQIRNRLSCVLGNPLSKRRTLVRRLARELPKPINNLEAPPIYYQLEHPFEKMT